MACDRCSGDADPAAVGEGSAAEANEASAPEGEAAATPSDGSEAVGEAAPTPPPIAPPELRAVERRPEVEASRELAARLGLAPPDPLFVADLLTRADIRELTRFQGELMETTLEGIAPSPDYNAIRIQANGGFGFAVQVWEYADPRDLSAQYRRLKETYFDSTLENSAVGNEAFSADFEGIRHYAFQHRASKSMAVVTCDRALCDAAQLRALAQRVANRL